MSQFEASTTVTARNVTYDALRCITCKKYDEPCLRGPVSSKTPASLINDCEDYIPKVIEHDMVHHPNHYCQGGIECIKAIEASMDSEGFQDYCKGNVLKYLWRWRDKAGIQDLEKAKVYLDWLIESAKKDMEADVKECL